MKKLLSRALICCNLDCFIGCFTDIEISLHRYLGMPSASTLCLIPCFLIPIFYFFVCLFTPFFCGAYPSVTYPKDTWDIYFWDSTCHLHSASQLTILGRFWILSGDFLLPGFNLRVSPPLTFTISNSLHFLSRKLGACTSSEEYNSFLCIFTFRSYHKYCYLVSYFSLWLSKRTRTGQ